MEQATLAQGREFKPHTWHRDHLEIKAEKKKENPAGMSIITLQQSENTRFTSDGLGAENW